MSAEGEGEGTLAGRAALGSLCEFRGLGSGLGLGLGLGLP